jgi:hypothetical protein
MRKKIMAFSFSQKEHAVSEIVGTLILIVIAVSTFSAVSIIILNPWTNFSNVDIPEVLLVGSIHNNDVVIEHQGGIPLDTKTTLTITIEGAADTFRVNDFSYWFDQNSDGLWTVGERVVYPAGNLQGKQVSCVVVDVDKNSIIFDKIIQKGTSVFSPYITVLPPDDVSETSATLKMYYNFYNTSYFKSGLLNFTYGVFGGPYLHSPSVKPVSLDGWYGLQLNGLLSGTRYEYWSWMNCSNGTLFDGPLSFYTYQVTRGLWHFDEAFGSTTAEDAMKPTVNGSVYNAAFIPGGKINRSLNFTGKTNYVDVPHHPKFNLTNEITIETWLNVSKIGAQFPGNVSELSIKNISDILGNSCFEPDLIHITGWMYAVAYRDNSSTSVTTFQMNDEGVFLGTIDTKIIPVPHFYEPTIINIHNNIYAIVYGASDDQTEAKSHIVTLSLYGNGTIGDIIDTFDFPQYYGREPNIINIGSDIYAIALGGASFEVYPTGYLVTVSIDNLGNIGSSLIDTLKFPLSASCSEPSIVHTTGDIYIITYNGYGATAGNGYVITVHILNNGSIVEPLEDTIQFGLPETGLEPTMIHVTNDIFAISYGADSNDQLRTGYIKTLSINSAGHVINASLDILPFYTYLSPIDYNFETDILHIEGKLYAISFTGGNNSNWKRGFLTTVSIENNGNISDSALFIYEFKGHAALGGSSALNLVTHVDRLIVIYGSINSSERGFLTMEKIDLIGEEKSIIQKGDAYALMVNYNLLTARMTIDDTTYTISGTISFDSWTKIDLTYGGGFLKLYVNDVIQTGGSEPCSGSLKTNTDHLIFGGGLFGSVDEIKIFRGVYVPS